MNCLKLQVINSATRQSELFLDPSLFFYFSCVPDDILRKISIWVDDTALNSSCDKASDLLQQAVMCNLILKIKTVGKYFYFWSAIFWFWLWYLKLFVQAHIVEAIIQN